MDLAFATLFDAFAILGAQSPRSRAVSPQWRPLLSHLKLVFENSSFLKTFPFSLSDCFFAMLDKTIFRRFPTIPRAWFADPCEPMISDPSWLDLFSIYGLLNCYLDARPDDPRFTPAFERRLLHQMCAPDRSERTAVADWFVAYVTVHPDREAALWSRMSYLLYLYIDGVIEPFAVYPVLIFFRMRFGRAKAEKCSGMRIHIVRTAVVPLISSPHFLGFAKRITAILKVLSDHDPGIAGELILEAVARWPHAMPSKQAEYIRWINRLLELAVPETMRKIARPLFTFYAELARSPFLRIVQASFEIWSNNAILANMLNHTRLIFTLLIPSILDGANSPDPLIQCACQETKLLLQALDPHMVCRVTTTLKDETGRSVAGLTENARNWATIGRLASKRDQSSTLADRAPIPCRRLEKPGESPSRRAVRPGQSQARIALSSSRPNLPPILLAASGR
jgi:hypothetical protein